MGQTTVTTGSTLRVDTHLIKFSQAWTILLAASAFIFNQPVIVLIAALAVTLTALVPEIGPFRLLYKYVVLPLHLWRPRVVEDDPAPHRFAQAVGSVFLIVATLLLFLTPAKTVGWILVLLMVALPAINLFVGFCAACFVYYHLGRLGILPRVRYTGSFRWRGV